MDTLRILACYQLISIQFLIIVLLMSQVRKRREIRRRRFRMMEQARNRRLQCLMLKNANRIAPRVASTRKRENGSVLRLRRCWVDLGRRVTLNNNQTLNIDGWKDSDYKTKLRMSKLTFDYISSMLNSDLKRQNAQFRASISVKMKVALSLYYLSHGKSSYRTISCLFGVDMSTVPRILDEFCDAAIKVIKPLYLSFPTDSEFREIADAFQSSFSLPGCIGVMKDEEMFVTKASPVGCEERLKSEASVFVRAVVNARGCFWDVNVGESSDTNTFQTGTLYTKYQENSFPPLISKLNGDNDDASAVQPPFYVLGSGPYPELDWIRNPCVMGSDHKLLMSTSFVVNNAFGRLRKRWQCLENETDCQDSLAKKLVLTCCVLHNVCEMRNEFHFGEQPVDEMRTDDADWKVAATTSTTGTDSLDDEPV